MPSVNTRDILPADNAALASIIRNALAEFGANKPGTVFFDPTTDDLFSVFRESGSKYFVAEMNGKIIGGAGIFPSPGLPTGTAELVKMYLSPETRGLGIGRMLMERCIQWASEFGYQQLYIETMPELGTAIGMYERFGFEKISGPLGNTGHFGCDVWMIKRIGANPNMVNAAAAIRNQQ